MYASWLLTRFTGNLAHGRFLGSMRATRGLTLSTDIRSDREVCNLEKLQGLEAPFRIHETTIVDATAVTS
jgi:hypothetical protein